MIIVVVSLFLFSFLFFLGDPFETTWNPASVVNNCYFLCNFIFVISAPLESVFGLANIHIGIFEKGGIWNISHAVAF